MEDAAERLVRELRDRIGEIEGLITLQAFEGRILAVVDEGDSNAVRPELEALGVAAERLDLLPVEKYLIPYPTVDPRLSPMEE